MQSKYETKLAECLARAGMGGKQIAFCLVEYKLEAARTGDEAKTFLNCCDRWGNEDAEKALASIQTELERLNKSHHGVDSNPVTRTRDYISRHNKWFDDIEKIGVEGVSLDGEKLKIKMPGYVKINESHAGVAQFKDKRVPMTLEISTR